MGSEVHLQNSIQVPAPRQRYRGCSDFQPPPWRRGRAAEQSLSPQSVTLLSFPSHGVSVAYLHLTVYPAPLSPLGSSSPSPKLPVSRRAQADPTLMGRRWSRDAGGGLLASRSLKLGSACILQEVGLAEKEKERAFQCKCHAGPQRPACVWHVEGFLDQTAKLFVRLMVSSPAGGEGAALSHVGHRISVSILCSVA